MNTREDRDGGEAESVGVRQRSEVSSALAALTDGQGAQSPQFRAGEAVAYEWALGRADSSPVTGRGVPGPPDLALLTAELDAVTVQLEDTGNLPGNTDYLRGLHAGLTWVCGYGTEPR
ncbi:hypothetical protein [Streptomyces sp. NPDC053069]|uniref:hypothetical protein n=1 Tax=Streptomyces sp. NPDC053069 TaxID=3365695 RepID=UPI0037D85E57